MSKQKFDERQLQARRKGVMLGFWSMIICLVLTAAIESFRGKPLFTSQAMLCYWVLWIGFIVMSGYLIVKDAYLGVNEGKNSLSLSLYCLGLSLSFVIIMPLDFSNLFGDGELVINLLSFLNLYFLVIGILLLFKSWPDGKQFSVKNNKQMITVVMIELSIVLVSIGLNWHKEPDLRNLLRNFLLPAIILALGVGMNRRQYQYSKWMVSLLGLVWFGYISLYYLIGFHNDNWY